MVKKGRQAITGRARMGEVSAYRAAKQLGVTTNTVVKWILNNKVKGRSDVYNGRPFYFVQEEEIKRLKPLIMKAKKDGIEGVSLL